MKEQRQQIYAALETSDPNQEIYQLAVEFRDDGMSQLDMYRLFNEFKGFWELTDPRYGAVADTMDAIWGGSWAKGRAIFETELTIEWNSCDVGGEC